MLILISCAKTMVASSKTSVLYKTIPLFKQKASDVAMQMSQFSVNELESLLRVNTKLALENFKRFQCFHSEENHSLQALLAYTGIVFKHIFPRDFTESDFLYAQEHLRMTSFVYGLLRPFDLIRNYRMEGDIRLPEFGGITMFEYWKPVLTDYFIETIKAQGGVLVNLASNEMKGLFDWKRVENEVRVITPEFPIEKESKLSTIVIYTKMARGEMARFILKNRIESPEELRTFDWQGFEFCPDMSDETKYLFVMSSKI